MKKIFTFFPIAVLLLITVSCSSKKTDQQISKIDSLANIIDSVDIKLKQICKDTIVYRYQIYKSTIDSVAKHIKDIRNDESWKYICAYQEVRKPFKTMTQNYDLYRAEIDSSIKQLSTLKHDVKAKLLSDDEFDAYFQNECNSVNSVSFRVLKNIESVSAQIKNFDTVHPYLTILLSNHKLGKSNK